MNRKSLNFLFNIFDFCGLKESVKLLIDRLFVGILLLIVIGLITLEVVTPQILVRNKIGLGCPEYFNPKETVHLPHPQFCQKYYTCLAHSAMENTCE